MERSNMLIFWLLVPVLAVLFALPICIAHVVVHVLIDRMHRPDRRRSTGTRTALLAPATQLSTRS